MKVIEATHEIALPGGHIATVSLADRELVAGFDWRALVQQRGIYVHAEHGKQHYYLHRLVVGAGPNEIVDHADRNGLNNTRSNLRIATRSQNGANRTGDRRRLGTTSEFKGVYFDRARGKWSASISVNGKTRNLGRFAAEVEAAIAYNAAAVEAWGDFALLNDVEGLGE